MAMIASSTSASTRRRTHLELYVRHCILLRRLTPPCRSSLAPDQLSNSTLASVHELMMNDMLNPLLICLVAECQKPRRVRPELRSPVKCIRKLRREPHQA